MTKTITVTSQSFTHEGQIPARYTCENEEDKSISPHLAWQNTPAKTKSFVVICDDPDAPGGSWVHWLVYNLPPTITELAENASVEALGGNVGTNNSGKQYFCGPCPPKGHGAHRYFFKIYALDCMLNLTGDVTKEKVESAMTGHVLAEGQMMGTFSR